MSAPASDNVSMCANCGKDEEDGSIQLKSCVACKIVKYCNVECQRSHRPQHKKECKKAAMLLHETALFQMPPKTECPICFITMTGSPLEMKYQNCCGKVICIGCIHAAYKLKGADICPFCRTVGHSYDDHEEMIKRITKRVNGGYHGLEQRTEETNKIYGWLAA